MGASVDAEQTLRIAAEGREVELPLSIVNALKEKQVAFRSPTEGMDYHDGVGRVALSSLSDPPSP